MLPTLEDRRPPLLASPLVLGWALALASMAGLTIGCSLMRRVAGQDGPSPGDPRLAALRAELGGAGGASEACVGAGALKHLADPAFARGVGESVLTEGVEPETWAACWRALERQPEGTVGPAVPGLVQGLATAYLRLLDNPEVEQLPRRRRQLEVAHAALWDRPSGWALPAPAAEALRTRLQTAPPAGPVARALAEESRTAVALEQGQYQGGPVSLAVLDRLEGSKAEAELGRMARRLPDASVQREARRRLLRLRLHASPFPELVADKEAVVETVLNKGTNPVTFTPASVRRMALDLTGAPANSLLVRQEVLAQKIRLLPARGEPPRAVRLPGLPLRGLLQLSLDRFARPITVCGHPAEMDPSPCLAPAEVRLPPGRVTADRDRALVVLPAELPASVLPELAASAPPQLSWRLEVASQGATAALPLRFERPPDLVLAASAGSGPDLVIEARAPPAGPVTLRVEQAAGGDGNKPLYLVVERADLASFRLISRGAAGKAGAPGLAGKDGESGISGPDSRCGFRGLPLPGAPGQDGTPGRPGRPGGHGGDGGNIRLRVHCAKDDCPAVTAPLKAAMRSEPGAGGAGGAGGKGGKGGEGGDYGRCLESNRATLHASAPPGRDAPSGDAGPAGQTGRLGSITLEIAP